MRRTLKLSVSLLVFLSYSVSHNKRPGDTAMLQTAFVVE